MMMLLLLLLWSLIVTAIGFSLIENFDCTTYPPRVCIGLHKLLVSKFDREYVYMFSGCVFIFYKEYKPNRLFAGLEFQ